MVWGLCIVLGLLLLTVGGLAAYFHFHKDGIRQVVLNELNQVLVAPVSVEKVEVGILHTFPAVSVEFRRVQGMGRQKEDPEPLFMAERVFLHFNLISMLKGDFEVEEIEVAGGEFNLKRYADLSNNYIIWRYNPEAKAIRFKLRKIISKNTLLRYQDLSSHVDVQFLCRNIQASGAFNGHRQAFNIKGSYHLQKLTVSQRVWLSDRFGRLNMALTHDAARQLFVLTKSDLSIENLHFSLAGNMAYDPEVLLNNTMDLRLEAKQLDIAALLPYLPAEKMPGWLSAYDLKGRLGVAVRMSGCYKYRDWELRADFECRNGQIRHKTSGLSLDKIQAEGFYTNGLIQPNGQSQAGFNAAVAQNRALKRNGAAQLHVESLAAQMGKGRISGRVDIQNFETPTIDFAGKITGDVGEFSRFAGQDVNVTVAGTAALDIRYRNTFSSFDLRRWTDAEIAAADCEARLQLADFSLAMPQSYSFTVATDSANILFSSSALTLSPCLLKLNNQMVEARIHIENLLPYWLSPTEKLYVSAEVAADAVRLEDWAYLMGGKTEAVAPAGTDGGSGKASASGSGAVRKPASVWQKKLLDHLHLTFMLRAGFIYDVHGPFENLRGRVYYTPDYLQLDDLTFEAYDGRLSGNVRLDFGPADSLSLSLAGRMDSVQIDRVFAAFNDFGQRQITSEQIKGALDMDFEMQAAWSPKRVFDAGKLAFSSDLHLRNGSLYQVAALRKLSKFTGEADLEHIRFADLRNHIDIVDRRVVIPRMSIESSLLNLDFSGVHRFDNTVDYRIDIELSDFLSRRRKQRALEKELGLVVTNTERLRLPIQIVGPIADPTIRYDMAAAREHRQEKFAKEREQIKAAFAAEKQRNRTGGDERKPVPLPSVTERNEFVIEFEDDAVQAPAPVSPEKPAAPAKSRKKKTAPKRDTTPADPVPVVIEWDD